MGRISSRGILGVFFILISILLIIISLVSNGWYTMEYKGNYGWFGVSIYEIVAEENHGLTEAKTLTTISEEEPSKSEDIELRDEEGKVAKLTLILLLVSIFLIFSCFVLGILGSIRKIPGFISAIVGFVAVLSICAPLIYYPLAYPDAVREDTRNMEDDRFEGLPGDISEEVQDGLFASGKIGGAYFLTCIGGAVLLVASCLFLGVKKRRYESPIKNNKDWLPDYPYPDVEW